MNISQTKNHAGTYALVLRLVVGWTYFSAFWRRTILADKLDPEMANYIGIKFNHFLPNALGIKPIIEYLLEHPDLLWLNMVLFTVIEGIVGLLIMLGTFTRLMSIGVFALAMGILLGSGWIGTTCLDEWQIGILGIAAGFVLFLSGSGQYSLDYLFHKKQLPFTRKKWFAWLGSGELPFSLSTTSKVVAIGSVIIFVIALSTNQIFHGGLWGKLHNKSVAPVIELSNGNLSDNELSFDVYRTEGVDVYGSWTIAIELINAKDEIVFSLEGDELANLPKETIVNQYVAKVKPGKHSLVVPLGAKATLHFTHPNLKELPHGEYRVVLSDISGAKWEHSFVKK